MPYGRPVGRRRKRRLHGEPPGGYFGRKKRVASDAGSDASSDSETTPTTATRREAVQVVAVPSMAFLSAGCAAGVWPLRERLLLASALLDTDNQQMTWPPISRRLAKFTPPPPSRPGGFARPPTWCSARACARQYSLLLDSAEMFRKQQIDVEKTAEEGRVIYQAPGDVAAATATVGLSLAEFIVKRLTVERVEELRNNVISAREKYKQLKELLAKVESGEFDYCMDALWAEIDKQQRQHFQQPKSPSKSSSPPKQQESSSTTLPQSQEASSSTSDSQPLEEVRAFAEALSSWKDPFDVPLAVWSVSRGSGLTQPRGITSSMVRTAHINASAAAAAAAAASIADDNGPAPIKIKRNGPGRPRLVRPAPTPPPPPLPSSSRLVPGRARKKASVVTDHHSLPCSPPVAEPVEDATVDVGERKAQSRASTPSTTVMSASDLEYDEEEIRLAAAGLRPDTTDELPSPQIEAVSPKLKAGSPGRMMSSPKAVEKAVASPPSLSAVQEDDDKATEGTDETVEQKEPVIPRPRKTQKSTKSKVGAATQRQPPAAVNKKEKRKSSTKKTADDSVAASVLAEEEEFRPRSLRLKLSRQDDGKLTVVKQDKPTEREEDREKVREAGASPKSAEVPAPPAEKVKTPPGSPVKIKISLSPNAKSVVVGSPSSSRKHTEQWSTEVLAEAFPTLSQEGVSPPRKRLRSCGPMSETGLYNVSKAILTAAQKEARSSKASAKASAESSAVQCSRRVRKRVFVHAVLARLTAVVYSAPQKTSKRVDKPVNVIAGGETEPELTPEVARAVYERLAPILQRITAECKAKRESSSKPAKKRPSKKSLESL